MIAGAEEAVSIPGRAGRMYGILHLPEPEPVRLLIMVVGGPQNRSGCHRAYTLMARDLAAEGIPVLRFDYAGLGDSEGPFVGYERAAPSIKAAVDFAYSRFPSLREVFLWSLCDGSAACAVYGHLDSRRISGMILCNPYVRTTEGQARAYLRHYYLRRLFDPAFLKRLATFRINPLNNLKSFLHEIRKAMKREPGPAPAGKAQARDVPSPDSDAGADGTFLERDVLGEVMRGVSRFRKPIHFLLSTEDLTAREFESAVKRRPETTRLLKGGGIFLIFLPGADHTFSKSVFRETVVRETAAIWTSGAKRMP